MRNANSQRKSIVELGRRRRLLFFYACQSLLTGDSESCRPVPGRVASRAECSEWESPHRGGAREPCCALVQSPGSYGHPATPAPPNIPIPPITVVARYEVKGHARLGLPLETGSKGVRAGGNIARNVASSSRRSSSGETQEDRPPHK